MLASVSPDARLSQQERLPRKGLLNAMSVSKTDLENQAKLQHVLLKEKKASKLENMVAALLGRLLGVPIAVAKVGFQHGGDGGPSGRQERRFRLECKKYSESSSLSARELLGEIDHALARDKALEAWLLIATCNVSEQIEQDLTQKGEQTGVPVVVIDWKDDDIAALAALCAFGPDLVEAEFGQEAGALARTLQPISVDAISTMRRNLQSWCLGFEALRIRSHEKLNKIWNFPRTSNAELGQNAAGGSQSKKVRRSAVHEGLNVWWRGVARTDAPAVVVGWDGVGKTWATLDWLVDSKAEQPIILTVPSSAVSSVSGISETSLKRFLADRLHEVGGVRDAEHWIHRLDYLLKRPTEEGAVLTVFFDGLNQEPSAPWLSILKVLQGEIFQGRVRVVVSTRTHYFEDKLSMLRGLIVPAALVKVDIYDSVPGGELDQMLAYEGLTQSELHPDLVELARTPRLFNLVMRFRDTLVEAGQVTIHRLLWEYGRDTFGVRAGRSFSELEWRAWLKEIAQKYLDGVREFSVKLLGETASRPDLSEREVYARLSDIIDGQFAKPGPSGSLQLTPTVVAHALGAALLAELDTIKMPIFATVEADLTRWLDPIAGFDQRAEILRAAVSILVERNGPTSSPIAGVLVTAWLQTQNVTDSHRHELAMLAPIFPDALLDAVEQSHDHTHASARLWAVNALRAIPKNNAAALSAIVTRLRAWFSIVSRDVNTYLNTNADIEKQRADRLKIRIGVDASGPINVVGVTLHIVDHGDGGLQSIAPSILEGFPLAQAQAVFEVAAVSLSVGHRNEGWNGLKWLCLLNEIDPDQMATVLRSLSNAVRTRESEKGVHPDLPAGAAAFLLYLSGQETDEDTAELLNPRIGRLFSYEEHYLKDPGRSWFALERRHSSIVLEDKKLSLLARIQRTEELWLDPTFEPPAPFVSELREALSGVDVEKLDRHSGYTVEDRGFEQLEPVLARIAPDLLADLIRRKVQSFSTCPEKSRYWSAIRSTEHILLMREAEALASQKLRLSAQDADESQEFFASFHLLMIELLNQDARTQFDLLIRANLKLISTEFAEILKPPTLDDIDTLIGRYGAGTTKQQQDLLELLSMHVVAFSDSAWSWVEGWTRRSNHEFRGLAFQILTGSNAARFGRLLSAEGWSWNPAAHFWVNHYGTGALIEAMSALPFDQLAPRLAPWRLLEAARVRGNDPAEIRLAAEIFGHVLAGGKIEEPDLGSTLSVERVEPKSFPVTISVMPRPSNEDSGDPVAALKAMMDFDAKIKVRRRATEIAVSRIRATWTSGASLYLANMAAEDFIPVLQHAPDMVERWLEGCDDSTTDFRRRVRLAEAAFMALCEALLAVDPDRGAKLWHCIRKVITTRYIGAAGVDDFLHMVFRVPDSPEINTLRYELLDLKRCNTDRALFDLAVAASYNGKADWLAAIVREDSGSRHAWRRKRSEILAGFTVNNTLPVKGAWPDGAIRTSYGQLAHRSACFRSADSCAHYWWRTYLQASDEIRAYAAWILFLRSVDHRGWVWMRKEIQATNDAGGLFRLKLSHAQLNRSTLKNSMEKRTEKLDKNFLDRAIVAGIGPWVTEPHLG
jgi:hypothetical protein